MLPPKKITTNNNVVCYSIKSENERHYKLKFKKLLIQGLK